MFEYLKTLPLTEAQKQLVNDEGYENAPTFYVLCKVVPLAIKDWLGLDSLDALETALWNLMTPEEQTSVQEELDDNKA